MSSSFFDSVHELKTKFPVIEETPVFMYKFIFLAFSLDKDRDDCYVSLINLVFPLTFYYSIIMIASPSLQTAAYFCLLSLKVQTTTFLNSSPRAYIFKISRYATVTSTEMDDLSY